MGKKCIQSWSRNLTLVKFPPECPFTKLVMKMWPFHFTSFIYHSLSFIIFYTVPQLPKTFNQHIQYLKKLSILHLKHWHVTAFLLFYFSLMVFFLLCYCPQHCINTSSYNNKTSLHMAQDVFSLVTLVWSSHTLWNSFSIQSNVKNRLKMRIEKAVLTHYFDGNNSIYSELNIPHSSGFVL